MVDVNYSENSPYADTEIIDNSYLGYYVHREIPESGSDVLISLDGKYENRPDLLSYDEYGTTDYWWVFAVRNMNIIKDPIYDFVAGIEIYIPTLQTLQENL